MQKGKKGKRKRNEKECCMDVPDVKSARYKNVEVRNAEKWNKNVKLCRNVITKVAKCNKSAEI